jgi:deoxyribonuclease V
MKETHIGHAFSVRKAHETQLRLSRQIIFEDDLPERISLVGGVDVAYGGDLSIGVAVVLDYDSLKLVESQTARCHTNFPYIPTLLSFREIPPAVKCIRKLKAEPDVFLVDGHGFAHPYRCGFATHLGLIIRKSTIGVAKGNLIRKVEETKRSRDTTLVEHNGEVVGAIVTTKNGCKPVYVSIGNMISLETAVKIVKHCTKENRIPEPILKAHRIAAEQKRKNHILSVAITSNE